MDLNEIQAIQSRVAIASKSEPFETVPNTHFKYARSLKAITYGIGQNEIQLRLTNLDDRFDGNFTSTIGVNINEWAREFFLEANAHFMAPNITNSSMRNTSLDMLEGVTLNITEMNLAGSIPVKLL